MLERLPHAPALRLLGRLTIERAQLEYRTSALRAAAVDQARLAAALRALPDIGAGIAAAAVLLVAVRGAAGPADAAAALAALGIAVSPLRDLAMVWDRQRAWRVASDRCAEALERPQLPRRQRGTHSPISTAAVDVRLANIHTPALRGFDAIVPAGQKVALVGANGAGKSSLLRVIAGLENTTAGTVTIGGRGPSDLSPAERRATISHLSLRAPILAGSLRRAMTMGCTTRPDNDAITAAAERCGLATVLHRLGGLDGRIAEQARNLSTGEARRILLVRLVLSDARLWLLDEPDDGLDPSGIDVLAELLHATPATVLIATHHRLLTRQVNEAWLLEAGQLVATGDVDLLLPACACATRKSLT